ncbi:MAG TPA: hypothetical protein PK167_10555, partial [Prolixibacteraceae bacterium]|nr:hypothetical protein [Prolixibacteraceae bacterium]
RCAGNEQLVRTKFSFDGIFFSLGGCWAGRASRRQPVAILNYFGLTESFLSQKPSTQKLFFIFAPYSETMKTVFNNTYYFWFYYFGSPKGIGR